MNTPKLFCLFLVVALTQGSHAGDNLWTFDGPGGGPTNLSAASPYVDDFRLMASFGHLFNWSEQDESWQRVAGFRRNVTSVEFDPNDPDVVFVGAHQGPLLMSTDAGRNFTSINSTLGGSSGTSSMALSTGGRLYAAMGNLAINYTDDQGGSWVPANTGLPSYFFGFRGVSDFDIAPSLPQRLYAIYANYGLYVSNDFGESWGQAVAAGLPQTLDGQFLRLFIDPLDPAHLYITSSVTYESFDSGGTFSLSSLGDVQRLDNVPTLPHHWIMSSIFTPIVSQSTDAGLTWAAISDEEEGLTDASVLADGRGLASSLNGAYVRDSEDAPWLPESRGLAATTPRQLVQNPTTGRVYVGTQSSGLFASDDHATNWQSIAGGPTQTGGLVSGALEDLVVSPHDDATLFAATRLPTAIYRSTDDGASWSTFGTLPLSGAAYVSQIAVADSDAQRMYFVAAESSGNFYASQDGGNNWTPRNVPTVGNVVNIAVNPEDAELVLVTTDAASVFRSTNGGISWSQTLTGSLFSSGTLNYSPHVAGRVYVGSTQSPYVSDDSGLTWSAFSQTLSFMDSALLEHPIYPDVFVTTVRGQGPIRSLDGGITWESFDELDPLVYHEWNSFSYADYELGLDVAHSEIVYATGDGGTGQSLGVYTISRDTSVLVETSAATIDLLATADVNVMLTNQSDKIAGRVQSSIDVSPNVHVVSAMLAGGACAIEDSTIECELDSLAPGDSAAISIVVEPIWLGGVTITATVASLEKDPNLADNAVTSTSLSVVSADVDGDGVADLDDNCVFMANADQRDSNADGFGNLCDADLNDDLIVNVVDLGILRTRFFSDDADADFNGDGTVNVVDLGLMRSRFFLAPGPSGLTPPVLVQ